MKILHLSYSNAEGGAFVAANRIHLALLKAGANSEMWVNRFVDTNGLSTTSLNKFDHAAHLFNKLSAKILVKALLKRGTGLHSPAWLPSRWVTRINESDADVVNLHWVNGEMLSIKDIGRIKKPLFWTLHDMWAFCGTEHYTNSTRWIESYHKSEYNKIIKGIDINRWVWLRKKKYWKRPINIITPSDWLLDAVRTSSLMKTWPVKSIRNPIDLSVWKGINKQEARSRLGLKSDIPLLLFGAVGGGSDPRKGYDLLVKSLKFLHHKVKNVELLVFGSSLNGPDSVQGYKTHYIGRLSNNEILRTAYSAADVFVLPSRQDNLPLTCIEALSCGTPVVAFNHFGPPTMIKHQETGYLAKPFDCHDFAFGLEYFLVDKNSEITQQKCKNFALENFSEEIVASEYLAFYEEALRKF